MKRRGVPWAASSLLWTLPFILPAATWAGESSSPRFVLQESSLNSAGRTSLGTVYTITDSLGQEATIGTSSSGQYITQAGLWSFLGSGLAPVVLSAASNPGNVENVDLTWTGMNAPYRIFQSTDCSNLSTGFFASTNDNSYTNIAPPTAMLVCYMVLATAPGP